MWHYNNNKSQYCNYDNKYNDDNMMRANSWFEFFDGLL